MPTYSITDPDGRTHTIDGPAGATREQVIAEIQKQLPYEQRTVVEQTPIDWREAGLGTMAKQGFNRAMTGLGSTVTDLIPALVGSALGFKDYAAEQLAENKAKMEASEAQNPTAFKSFRDVRGVGDAAGYVAETFGELIPDIVALMTGAGAASVVGKRVALKGVEKLVATRAAEGAAARGLEGEAAAAFTKTFTEKMAERAAPVIARVGAEGSATGLKYGLPASSYALNAPDVFGSIYEKTEEQSPGIAALMGVPIAMLDTFLPGQILNKLGMAGKAKLGMAIISDSKVLPGSFKAAALKELGTVVAAEGLTESAQEALTVAAEMMAGAKGEFFSQENIDRYINAGLKGAIGGGAFGAPGAIRSGLQAKGEKDRLADVAIPVETPQQALLALENKLFTSVVFPDGSVATTPEQVKEYEESLFRKRFAPQPADVLFTPEDIAAETARRSAEAPTPTNSAQEAAGAFTAANRQPAPPLFPELPPVYAPESPTPEVAPTVTKQELLGLGISKNARVSGMAQPVPLVTFLSGLPLDNPQNVNTVVTQLSAFAANPAVAPEVKANVNQFLRGLVQSIQTMNTQQGALQFAPAAPEALLNTPMQAPLADFGANRQRQQQIDAQRESDFQKAEAQRDVQQQLELARQGAQRDANERQKEARAVRLAQEAKQNRLNREAKIAAQYPGLAQGQQQGDLFGLTYPEAPPSTSFTPRAAPPEVSPDQLSMIGPRGGITKEAKRGTTTDPLAGKSAVVPSQPASSVPSGGAAASEAGGVGGAAQSAGTTSVGEGAQSGALEQQAPPPVADKAAPAKAKPKRPIKGFGAGKTEQQAAAEARTNAAADKAAADKVAADKVAADKVAAAEVQRKINKIALNDQKAKAAANKAAADKAAADKAAATKAAAAKAKAETDEAEQQQNNLRSEAKSILSAAGNTQAEITDLLENYDSFTPEDIADLRRDNPPQGQKPKSKITTKEVDKLAETTDAVEAVEASDNDIVEGAVAELNKADVAKLETHYGEEADSEGFAKKLRKDIQTATNKGIAAVSKNIRSVINKLIALILAVSAAFNPVTFNSDAQALSLPLPQTTTKLIQIINKPRADFGAVVPSNTIAVLADYVVGTNNNMGKPFILTDKPTATSYVFDAKGTLTAAAPVLLGAVKYADVIPASALNKTVAQTTQAEKVTPAGRFEGEVELDSSYGSTFTFIKLGNSSLAGHIVYTGTPSENRPGRLATPTVDDNFISYGCLNYGKKFYKDHIEKQFKGGGIQYITPMVQTLEETFPGITAYSPTTTVTTVVTSIINNPQSTTDVANHSEQGVLRQRPAKRKARRRRLYSMADMRKLPKTSDKGFAESVNTLRRKDESPYIVQETKTSDDINKIADEVLKDVAANPERYAIQVNNLTADQYFRDETTGEKVDITDPDQHYRLSDLGLQLAKVDSATLKAMLQEEAEQTTKQRQKALVDLSNYLIGNDDYTPTEAGRIVLLASKLTYTESKEGVQIVQLANNNRHVMTVSGELASRINEKLNGGLPIKEALKKAVEENTAAQRKSSDKQGWKKYEQSEAYDDAAVLSQEVCGTGWCTGTTSTAQDQLSKGDFWVYFDNGKPEIALRTEDGNLTAQDPPRGTLSGQRLSLEYQEIADKFLKTTDEVKGGEAYLKARDAMKAYRTYKKTNDIVPLRKYLRYTLEGGAFSEAVFVEPRELSGYGEPAEYPIGDPEYVGKQTPRRVPFNVNLLDSTTTLEYVGGKLYAKNLTNAPLLETVGGYLIAYNLTNAPLLETVGGELDAENLTNAPLLETVGGYLSAKNLTNAPLLETVGGDLYAENLTNAPLLETVGRDLSAYNLTNAPMLKTVGGYLYAENLTSAPMLETVGGYLSADNLTSAPMLKTVGGKLYAKNLTNAPLLETVGGELDAENLTNAPLLETVGGYLSAKNLTNAPLLETVGGYLSAYNLTNAPLLETVGGELRAYNLTSAPMLRKVNGVEVSSIGKAEPLYLPTEKQLEESYNTPLPAAAVSALENNDLKGALRALSTNKNSEVAKLAKGLLNANLNATVKLTKGLKNDKGQAVPGFYDPETNTVHLDPTSMTTHTVLHEAAHSGLSHVIEDKNNIVTRQLNKLFNDVIPMLDGAYGAESLQEFVAETRSNLEFRGKLNAMNPDGSAITAWQRFTNIVGNWMRRLMGNPTRSIGSALDKTDKLVAIILSPAPLSRDGGALYAAALYGKTGLEKLFESVASVVPMGTPAQKQRAIYAATELVKGTGVGGLEKIGLGLLTLNLLADVAAPLVPNAANFNGAVNRRTGKHNARNAQIEPLIKRAQNWAKAHPALEIIFNNVVYFSTVNGVDPAKKESEYDAKPTKDKQGNPVAPSSAALDEAEKIKASWREVKADYEKLKPEGQALYKAMRDAYGQMYKEILKALSRKVDLIPGITPNEAAEIKNKVFAELLSKANLDPYFPLTRSGNYWLSYLVSGTEGYAVEAFKSEAARSSRIRELLDKKVVSLVEVERDGKTVKEPNVQVYSNLNQMGYKRVPATSFVGAVLTRLERGGVNEKVRNEVLKLFLDTLPETAFAKAFQPRKKTPGFERDAISALRSKMYNTSRQLANMETASEIEKLIAEARETAQLMTQGKLKDAQGNYIPPSDNAKVVAIINEFEARLAFINNPKVPALSQALTSTGFNMLLGANISSAVVNLMQVPMILAPYLTGEHGFIETSSAIFNAYKIFAGSGISRQQEVFGTNEKDKVTTGLSIINYAPDSKYGKEYKTAIKIWEANAQLGSSMTYDVLDAPTSRINFWSGLPFHHAERINREVSLISAYNLEMDRLKKYGAKTKDGILASTLTPEGRETAAANYAVYVAEMTQGGTSAASAPRYAQGPVGRVLLMFKRYGIMSLYLQFKMMKQALVGATAAERKAAMTQFAGITGMSVLFAGLQGIPFFGAAAFIHSLFKDDDDDDLATEVRNVAGPFWTYGPVSALTNLNIAGRLSQTDLLFRDMQQGSSPSALATLGTQLLGPVYGVASKVERGFTLMGEGHLERGIEQVLPSAFGNLFKAYRFATEGANTLRGDPITGEVNAWNVGAEAFGFLPADYARQLEITNHLKGIDKYVSTKETKLLRQYYTARRFGDFDGQQDAREDLQALFRKHPGLGNLNEVIDRSMTSHQKTTSRMISGATYNAKLESELRRRGAAME